MDQSITLALIGIVPAIITSIITYGISSKKTKVDLKKSFSDKHEIRSLFQKTPIIN